MIEKISEYKNKGTVLEDDKKKVSATESLLNKIMAVLNESIIIQIIVQNNGHRRKFYRNTQIWKDGNNFKEKHIYESDITGISSLIFHDYTKVRMEFTLRLVFKKLFLINSFIDLDEACIIIMKYLMGNNADDD